MYVLITFLQAVSAMAETVILIGLKKFLEDKSNPGDDNDGVSTSCCCVSVGLARIGDAYQIGKAALTKASETKGRENEVEGWNAKKKKSGGAGGRDSCWVKWVDRITFVVNLCVSLAMSGYLAIQYNRKF